MDTPDQNQQQNKNKKENFFSEWLEQLQQESWQLELLISGLALFGIWESGSLIERLQYYCDVNVDSEYRFYTNVLLMVLNAGWAIFLTNLLIHIIIRGLWIGAIGLRYVSGDIDFDTFNYSEVFIKYYKKRIGSFDSYIERLEKLSSVLFSFTFLLFFMFISFAAANLAFVITLNLLESVISDDHLKSVLSGFIGISYYGIGLLVLIDFFTLGAFKKVKDRGFSLVYFWIYRFYSTVSLSFIFRPLLLNFIDNKYTRRLFFLAIPYSLIILIGGKGIFFEKSVYIPDFGIRSGYHSQMSQLSVNWLYYDDLREAHFNTFNTGSSLPQKEKIYRVSLDQYENDDNSLSLFLEYQSGDEEYIEEATGIRPFREPGIGHSFFAKGILKDPGLTRIDSIYVVRTKLLSQVIRKPDDPIEEILQNTYSDDIAYWKKHTEEELSTLREELGSDLESQKNNYMENKLEGILKAILNMHTFMINDQEVNPSVSYFMEHPNMHEPGVICYFPLDSISLGNHILKIEKSRQQKDCTKGCSTRTFYLPFRKL